MPAEHPLTSEEKFRVIYNAVAFILQWNQFILKWQEYEALSRFRSLAQVKGILVSFYNELISLENSSIYFKWWIFTVQDD